MKRLAIITTHPIQYNAPLFRLLAERQEVSVKVFYTWSQAGGSVYDPGFGKSREWDIPLLEGYDHAFVENTARKPGSHHFWGIQNPDLVTAVASWQPDAILVFGWSFYSHLKALLHFKGRLPVLFRGDSTLLDDLIGLRSAFRHIFLKWVYKHVDTAFYTGENNRVYFEKFGLKSDQLIQALHTVDNDRFSGITQSQERELEQWQEKLGIRPTDWVILFAGKLEEKKNPRFLLQLADLLHDENIRFLIVGNGHLESDLKKAAVDSRFIFMDFQNQSKMPVVYRLGNVLVMPSKGPGETWGLAANEAMASGLPVILSEKVGGAADLVLQEENGLVFKLGDVNRVMQYIYRLKKDKDFYRSSQEKAKSRISNFTLEAVANAIEKAVLREKEKEFCAMLV